MQPLIPALFGAALLVGACVADKAQAPAAPEAPSGAVSATLESELLDPGVGDRVLFDYDSYELRPDARATIEKWAALLARYPDRSVAIEGHCDERGTREYNLALGERRANAVMRYLRALGVDADRLRSVSLGKESPAADGHDEIAWGQNRRGVLVPDVPLN